MRSLMEYIVAIIDMFRLIGRHEPKYFLYFLPKMLLKSVLPFLHIYMPKLIIEGLTEKRPYGDILTVVGVYSLAMLFINILHDVLDTKSQMCGTAFDRKLRLEVGQTVMDLQLKDMEGASMQDAIRLAQSSGELITVADVLNQMLQNIITIAGVAFIVASFDVRLFAGIALILCCKVFFTRLEHGYSKTMRIFMAQNNRVGDYLNQVCYFSPGGAKEIRTNNLQNWILSKVKQYRERMVNQQIKSFRRQAAFEGINAVIMGIFTFVVLLMLSARFIEKGISIADFTMYFTAVTTLVTTLLAFTDLMGQYNLQLLKVTDYKKLVKILEGQEKGETAHGGTGIHEIREISFEGVYFAYPNSENYVLKDINITIRKNEKLVIVGLNGAGKSTFIKLLCKFYRPTKGTIRLNGIDIWDIPNKEYYRLISAVFQDFSTFAFTVLENITLKEGKEDVEAVLEALKLKEHVAKFPKGVNTYLSKEFSPDGVEVSGGQKQKISIARALYKDAPLIILDEPTASLDPKAENEIYTDLFHIAENKTTIFISHRLAASSIADRIAVFVDGRILEYGTHDELIRKNGIYADMYRKQSFSYVG